MNNQMLELCARALWDKEQQDLANQFKYRNIAKKPGPISWTDINDPDIIPSLADRYREGAKLVALTLRRWVASNSKDSADMLDVFLMATDSNQYEEMLE